MQLSRERRLAVGSSALAAAALVFALAAEWGGGLVPCALCLLERWPYWIAIGLGALAFLLPRRGARLALITLALVVLSGTAMAIVHVGVEQRWWPSPLPECAAPRLTGGSVAERMANMPARPAKPCDDPTYVVPGLPVSMAAANGVFALAFGVGLLMLLRSGALPAARPARRPARRPG